MSLVKIAALVQAVDAGNITAAAQRLGYSQSAVSKMIRDLEEEWGISVLLRGRKGVELTSEGKTLLPALRQLLCGYDNLQFVLADLHGLKQGVLRLGTINSLAAGGLPGVLKAFHREYPSIRIELLEGEYAEIADWLRKGMVDCGFLGENERREFDAEPVFRDEMVVVLPLDHPLSGAAYYPVKRLEEDDFIGMKEIQDYDYAEYLDAQKVKPRIAYEVENDNVQLSMVESGLGVCLAYEHVLDANRFRVAAKRPDKRKVRTIYAALRREDVDKTVARLFRDFLMDYVGKKEIFPAAGEVNEKCGGTKREEKEEGGGTAAGNENG